MKQTKFPCCKEKMIEIDVFYLIENGGSSCPTVECPHCHKLLTVYLNIDSVEVQDE